MNNNYCEHCGSYNSLVKNGKDKNSNQRFKCKNCLKVFISDKTPTKHLRLSTYKIKKIIAFMIDDVSLEVIARNLELNIKTILYYRYIIFNSLSLYQETIKLSGTIIIDETFISIREKEYMHTRPDGKGIRGLSFNQLCIVTMVTTEGFAVAKITSRAMPLPSHYINQFTINIGNVNKFVHDGNTKTFQFMKQFNVPIINGKKDSSGIYSIISVDNFHNTLKRFLFKHSGYKLKNLQHYLNFFVYRQNYITSSKPKNMREQIEVKNKMINSIYKVLLETNKKVSYKDFMSDKGITEILENR